MIRMLLICLARNMQLEEIEKADWLVWKHATACGDGYRIQ